jgi:hypothetical protein
MLVRNTCIELSHHLKLNRALQVIDMVIQWGVNLEITIKACFSVISMQGAIV